MTRPAPAPLRLAVLVGLLVTARAAAAQEPAAPGAIRSLIAVELGSTPAELRAAASTAHVRCELSATPGSAATTSPARIAYVCAPPPAPPPFEASATYWYENGRLARVYLVGISSQPDFGLQERFYRSVVRAFGPRLGAPVMLDQIPADRVGPPPTDAQRAQDVITGRATLRARWSFEGAVVEVSLQGAGGRMSLVASIIGGGAPGTTPATCDPGTVRDALFDLFPPADESARARATRRLAECRVSGAAGALGAAQSHDPSPAVRADALRALAAIGKGPDDDALATLAAGTEPVAEAAREIRKARLATAAARTEQAKAPAPVEPFRPAAATEGHAPLPDVAKAEPPTGGAAVAAPSLVQEGISASPAPEEAPARPWSGTPLTMAASTVAGATLMRNLGLMGGQGLNDFTPQLLLGSAGAIIGFGTSWGLSRFGIRPSVEQAAWFTNMTAWGTLAGLTAWGASDSTSPKLQYGALVLGEAAGLGLGALTAHKWRWSGPQIVLADSLVIGTALAASGIRMAQDEEARIRPMHALALPLVMTGAAIAAYKMSPTTNDLKLMTFGALAGGWTGGLLVAGATSTDFLSNRRSLGGAMSGAAVGFLGSAAVGAFSETEGWRLGVAGAGMAAGSALGLGVSMTVASLQHGPETTTFTDDETKGWALGAGIGGVALSAAAYAYAPHLHLGPRATAMTIEGAVYGAGVWWTALTAASHGPVSDIDTATLQGGLLAGATLGGITGLVSSRWFAPDGNAQVTTAAATGLGMAGGLGFARLATDTSTPGGADFWGVTLGAGIGFAGGAIATHRTALRPPDVAAGVAGMGFGALLGTLAPSLDEDNWRSGRLANGGAWLGLALGGAGATAASHLTDADGGQVTVATLGGGFGLLTGLGAGLMAGCTSGYCRGQAPRIGTVAGTLGGATLGLLLDSQLHLSEGLGPNAAAMGAWGGAFGIVDGLLLADALDESRDSQVGGAVLMLGSAEMAAGLVLSKKVTLRPGDLTVAVSGRLAGGAIGLGTAMLIADDGDRVDTLATLGGSLAGLGAAVATEIVSPLDQTDAAAASVGAVSGAILGTLAPTLGMDQANVSVERQMGGGFLLGIGAGAVAGAAARHATGASGRTVALTALGGADGLATGLGIGLLANDVYSSHGSRVGAFVGTAAGLGMGSLLLPRLELDGTRAVITGGAAGVVGGWTGVWLPVLGYASIDEVAEGRQGAGFLTGAGLATFGGLMFEATAHPSPDLVGNALALDALFSAAGAGAGALASTRAEAAVGGMLGAGTAGLIVGGALHEVIDLDEKDAPLLTLSAGEGLWLGGWLPYALRDWDQVTGQQTAGGLALGGAGSLGLATLASGAFELSGPAAGYTALGSGIGAAMGGGIALVSPSLHDRRGVGLMLGGTGLGLAAGAALAPRLSLAPASTALGASMVGGTLGVAESLLFAWSARTDASTSYGGAALIGGGIGATLGLAVAAAPADDRNSNIPAAAGFAAWGAWMGSFSGALIKNDAHEIVLGGLIGTNVGFLTGYGLLRTDAVNPEDFGWLSLFGALGTVAGAGVGAPFSTRAEPGPVLAGMAIGPAVGMIAGAVLLPKLRRFGDRPAGASARLRALPAPSLHAFAAPTPAHHAGAVSSTDLDGNPLPLPELLSPNFMPAPGRGLLRKLRQVVEITQWSPLLGALPAPRETGPPPMLFGVTGLWR